jgi:hypothetical protein
MRSPRNVGLSLLGVWLIIHGLIGIMPLLVPGLSVVLSLIAIAAGILILMGR